MARFGPYELEQRLGSGGMGEAFLARLTRQDQFEKELVIKRILPQLSADPGFRALFQREARLAALLSHQNIVQIFDYGEVEGHSYIAMEFVDGIDGASLLRAHDGPLPVEAALTIIKGAARGLDYAHRKTGAGGEPLGLVHRDVSPKNILISCEGEVKWIDFGLAHAKAVEGQTAEIAGTLSYMAPEQIEGLEIDQRIDVFGLGATAHELLVGEPPFRSSGTFAEHLAQVRAGAFSAPSSRRGQLSAAFDQLIARALAPHRDDRFPTVREFLAALEPIAAEAGEMPPDRLGELVKRSTGRETCLSDIPRTAVGAAPIKAAIPRRQPTAPALAPVKSSGPVDTTAGQRVGTEPALVPVASTSNAGHEAPAPGVDPRAVTEPALQPVQEPRSAARAFEVTRPLSDDEPVVVSTSTVPSGRRGWMAALIGLVLAVGLAAAVWWQWPTREEAPPAPAPSWTIHVSSSPKGASVEWQGEMVGTTPLVLGDVSPAPGYHLRVYAEGYRPHDEDIELGADGGSVARAISLTPKDATLLVRVVPVDSSVTVNGNPWRQGAPTALPAGSAVVVVTHPGYTDQMQTLTIEPGGARELDVALVPLPATLMLASSTAGTEVSIVDETLDEVVATCHAPCMLDAIAAGAYTILAHAPLASCQRTAVELSPGARHELEVVCHPTQQGHGSAHDIVLRAVSGRLEAGGKRGKRVGLHAGSFSFVGDGIELRGKFERSAEGITISVRSETFARLLVDGKAYTSPLAYHRLTPGRHRIRVLSGAASGEVGFDLSVPD